MIMSFDFLVEGSQGCLDFRAHGLPLNLSLHLVEIKIEFSKSMDNVQAA
jgi:hypothetical protein